MDKVVYDLNGILWAALLQQKRVSSEKKMQNHFLIPKFLMLQNDWWLVSAKHFYCDNNDIMKITIQNMKRHIC